VIRVTPGAAPASDDAPVRPRRFNTRLEAAFEAGAVRARGTVQNVGRGGLFVGTASIPKHGDRVNVRFRAPGGSEIQVLGLVWWTTAERPIYGAGTDPQGFGVRLLEAGPAYEAFVTRLWRERYDA
jgi:hypothetical protein